VINVNIVTVESDLGAGKKGAKLGPSEILKHIQLYNHALSKAPVYPVEIITSEDSNKLPLAKNLDSILPLQQQVIVNIQQILKNNAFPLILSGDHSTGAGVIAAIKDFYPQKNLGVIWIDAHADLHNPHTTPSGNVHGMPLAASLAIRHQQNTKNKPAKKEEELWLEFEKLGSNKITPKILPQNLVFIALRDFEQEEIDIINQLQIKYYTPQHIAQNSIKQVATETLDYLNTCDIILVSFDVDSMDPSVSSGTGTAVVNGLQFNQAADLLHLLTKSNKLVALEITEVNPLLDRVNPMEEVTAKLLTRVF